MALKRIVVASDLSERAERALRRGIALAERSGAALTLLHVLDEDLPEPIQEAMADIAADYLRGRLTALAGPKITEGAEILALAGPGFQAIVDLAAERAADLLLIGEHRRHLLRDVFAGTTAERVLRRARLPVLVVRREAVAPEPPALVALDFGPGTERVLEAALPMLGDRPPLLLHTLPDGDQALRRMDLTLHGGVTGTGFDIALDAEQAGQTDRSADAALRALAERAGLAADRTQLRIAHGPVAETIERLAAEIGAGTVVLGTRTAGLGAISRRMLGSVAERLVARLPCDVLTVPLSDADEATTPD